MRALQREGATPRHEAPPRKILVPVDFSQASTAALLVAGELSASYGTELTVLNAMPKGTAPMARKAIEDALKAEVTHTIGASGLTVRVVTREDEPVAAILDEQRTGEHDLIVMGTHVVGLPEDDSIGGTATAVVQSAACNIRLVRFSISGEEAALFTQPLRSFAVN